MTAVLVLNQALQNLAAVAVHFVQLMVLGLLAVGVNGVAVTSHAVVVHKPEHDLYIAHTTTALIQNQAQLSPSHATQLHAQVIAGNLEAGEAAASLVVAVRKQDLFHVNEVMGKL